MTVKASMTPLQYQKTREAFDLPNYQFHRALGISLRQAQRYEAGEQDIPTPIARLIEMFEMHGIPTEWLENP